MSLLDVFNKLTILDLVTIAKFLVENLSLLADIQNFIVDKLVSFTLVDSMRGAVFLAVATVAVASVFYTQRLVAPFSFDSYEGRTAVAAFKLSRIAVTGMPANSSGIMMSSYKAA